MTSVSGLISGKSRDTALRIVEKKMTRKWVILCRKLVKIMIYWREVKEMTKMRNTMSTTMKRKTEKMLERMSQI